MNPKRAAPIRASPLRGERAYVLFNNGIIIPPVAFGKKITVRACDADGVQSGPVKKVSPKDLRLEPLSAPLRLAPCGV